MSLGSRMAAPFSKQIVEITRKKNLLNPSKSFLKSNIAPTKTSSHQITLINSYEQKWNYSKKASPSSYAWLVAAGALGIVSNKIWGESSNPVQNSFPQTKLSNAWISLLGVAHCDALPTTDQQAQLIEIGMGNKLQTPFSILSIKKYEDPKLPESPLLSVQLRFTPYTGSSFETDLLIPSSNIRSTLPIDTIETEGLQWAKEEGIYPGKLIKVLESTFVSGLIGVCYPAFSDKESRLMDKWIRALFGIDDWLDMASGAKISSESIGIATERKLFIIEEIFKGQDPANVLKNSDTQLTKTMARLTVEIRSLLQEKGVGYESFFNTLKSYFQSITTDLMKSRADLLLWKPAEKSELMLAELCTQ